MLMQSPMYFHGNKITQEIKIILIGGDLYSLIFIRFREKLTCLNLCSGG